MTNVTKKFGAMTLCIHHLIAYALKRKGETLMNWYDLLLFAQR